LNFFKNLIQVIETDVDSVLACCSIYQVVPEVSFVDRRNGPSQWAGLGLQSPIKPIGISLCNRYIMTFSTNYIEFEFRILDLSIYISIYFNFEQDPISTGRDIAESINFDILISDIYFRSR
jgi:hypothetical protein